MASMTFYRLLRLPADRSNNAMTEPRRAATNVARGQRLNEQEGQRHGDVR